MTLGGVYMTLGNFEGAQIDSVVTGIAAEYEKNGTTIDHIVVTSAMTDDDLLWVIAINSAAHQQDLNTMSADLIRDFCKSSLSYTPSLSFMDSGDDAHPLDIHVSLFLLRTAGREFHPYTSYRGIVRADHRLIIGEVWFH